MTHDVLHPAGLARVLDDLRAREEPYAVATIIRTAGATAAKPGAKALLSADGTILHGWLGGGCTRGAVRKAAQEALRDGAPQLVSIAPEEVLSARNLTPGDTVDGARIARNGCPSKGSIDVFIEPCLPQPVLHLFGASPVALAIEALAPRFDWRVEACTAEALPSGPTPKATVIATQGQGDLDALRAVLAGACDFVAFVGSRRKYASLADRLIAAGIPEARAHSVKAPAGLDIGAVTPDEIALSILAELTQVRRRGLRPRNAGHAMIRLANRLRRLFTLTPEQAETLSRVKFPCC